MFVLQQKSVGSAVTIIIYSFEIHNSTSILKLSHDTVMQSFQWVQAFSVNKIFPHLETYLTILISILNSFCIYKLVFCSQSVACLSTQLPSWSHSGQVDSQCYFYALWTFYIFVQPKGFKLFIAIQLLMSRSIF